MPYWLNSMLAATPALLWMFGLVGLPWALVVLPRRDWRDYSLVACLMLAFGPALVTAWMFMLGSAGAVNQSVLLRLDYVLAGTAIIGLAGWGLAWKKQKTLPHARLSGSQPSLSNRDMEPAGSRRLHWDEKLLIALIGTALAVRWIGVAYWPSTAYDALWVYAYEGKLYTLLGYIPNSIAYYPQFLPLQHTFLQLWVGGLDDHTARAVLPWLHLGSILATYVLGSRLFTRRTGIFAAAIWALYPHVGEWSRYGDLEIPVAFLFTAASVFFLMAWRGTSNALSPNTAKGGEPQGRRQYALIAGLLLGIGMWTKPTMGAFIWSVGLIAAATIGRQWWLGRGSALPLRENLRLVWPRLELVMLAGVACIPLGAVWYIRNILLGHNPIDLPPGFWQSLAAQSGAEFGWPLLALLALAGWVVSEQVKSANLKVKSQSVWLLMLAGLALVAAGVVPSMAGQQRMSLIEWLALAAGAALIFVALRRWARDRWTEEGRQYAATMGWLALLALPYFVTWFFSYSYHYRLSFAIVPLLIMPTALIVAHWTEGNLRAGKSWAWYGVYGLALLGLALPGIVIPLYDPNAGWDWLWTDKLPDDHARYQSGNVALLAVVDGLQAYVDGDNPPLRVVAPGMKMLPFFFPLEDIRIDYMPTRLSELEGITYFIYGTPESGGDFNTIQPTDNQVLSALSMATTNPNDQLQPIRAAWWNDDGILKYTVFELRLAKRFEQAHVNVPTAGETDFGGFVRLLGHDIGGAELWQGRKVIMHLYWQSIAPAPADYRIYVHLRDADGTVWDSWDGPMTESEDGNYYPVPLWETGEYLIDTRTIILDNPDTPLGEGYQIVVGLYDPLTNERVPMTVDGQAAGDGYVVPEALQVVNAP